MKPTARPTCEGPTQGNIVVHSVLSTKRMHHLRRAKHGGRFVAFGVEKRSENIHGRAGRGMTQLRRALDGLFGQLAGADDFAKAPHRQREMRGSQDPRIKSKTESRQRIAIRRIIGVGLFKEGLRLPEIALKKTGRAETTAGGARFRGAPPASASRRKASAVPRAWDHSARM